MIPSPVCGGRLSSAFRFFFALACAFVAGTTLPLSAQTTLYWDATGASSVNGGSGIWGDNVGPRWHSKPVSDFVGDTIPQIWDNTGIADNAVFQNTAGDVALFSNIVANSITFGTSGYRLQTFSGKTLRLISGNIDTGSGSQTIAVEMTGAFYFNKHGSGTLTLSAANSYTGGTIVNDGTLVISSGGSIGSSSTPPITVGKGNGKNGTLNILAGGSASGSSINIGSDSSTGNSNTGTVNVSGTLSSTGSFYVGIRGEGTLNILSGGAVNVNSGQGTVNLGTLGGKGTLNISGSTPGILNAGAVDGASSDSTLNFNHTHSDYHFTSNGAANGTAIDITGLTDVYQLGSGKTTLSGTNTYAGHTFVRNGTLEIASGGSISHPSSHLYLGTAHGENGTFNLLADSTATNNATLIGHSAGSTGLLFLRGSPSTTSTLNNNSLDIGLSGTGTVNLNNASFINVNSGAGTANLANLPGSIGTLNIMGSYQAGVLNAASVLGGQGTATLNFSHVDSDYHFTKTGASGGAAVTITGSTAVNHTSSGTTTLSGTNSYTGGTTISAGTLIGTTSSLPGYITNNAALTFDQNTNGFYSLPLSGTGSVTKAGTGILTLAGANIYTGNTTVSGGTLKLSSGGSITHPSGQTYVAFANGENATLQIDSGSTVSNDYGILGHDAGSAGTVNVSGSWINARNLFVGRYGTGALTISSGGIVSNNVGYVGYGAGGTANVSGTWNNSSSFYVGMVNQGAGVLTIQNGGLVSNTYGYLGNAAGSTGTAHVSGTWTHSNQLYVGYSGDGILNLNNGGKVNVISGTGTATLGYTSGVGSSGTININGSTTPGVLNAASVDGRAGTATLNFNHTAADHHFTKTGALGGTPITITGNTTVNHTGSGTTTLRAANTYTGGTTISSGRLIGDTTSLQRNITNNAALTFDQSATGTYAGIISGTGSVAKTGTGTVILSGANAYSGGTTVSAGTLRGTTTSLQGNITNNANVTFNQFSTGSYIGNMTGSGSVTKLGSATSIFTGTNNYAGATNINAGILQFAQAGSLYNNTPASWNATHLKVASGATAAFNVGGSGEFTSAHIDSLKALGTASGGFASGSVLGLDTTNASGGNFTYASAISDSNSGSNDLGIHKLGTGILTLTGANTYTGGTIISAGTLVGNTTSLQGNITNNAALTFDQNTNGTYAGILSGSGNVNKSGTAAVTLTGNNAYTGVTTIEAGTLNIAAGGSISDYRGIIGSAAASNGSANVSGTWTNSDRLIVAGSGNGTLTIADGGEVNVQSGLAFTSLANGAGSTGTLNINGSTAPGVINTIGILGGLGTATLNFNHSDSGYHFTRNGASGGTAVTINGTTTVNHTGTGSTTLSGINNYTGGTNLSAGTLNLSSGGSISHASAPVNTGTQASDSATLQINNGSSVSSSVVNLGTVAGSSGILNITGSTAAGVLNASSVNGGPGTATLNFNHSVSSHNFTTNGAHNGTAIPITGSTTVNQTGSGITVLRTPNTHTGGTNISAGRLALVHATDTLPDTGTVTLTGGILDISNHSDSIGVLNLTNGSIVGTTGVLSPTSTNVQSGSISANLGGSGDLNKTGASTVTLSGTNTFSQHTNISAGALNIAAGGSITRSSFGTYVGRYNDDTGSFQIAQGATVSERFAHVAAANNTNSSADIAGTWNHNFNFFVGTSGVGLLTIQPTGTVTTPLGYLGFNANGTGTANVAGLWNNQNLATIGRQGIGILNLQNGGTFTVNSGNGLLTVAELAGSSGTINISGSTTPGVVNAASVHGGLGTATLNFNHTNSDYHFTINGEANGTAIPITGSSAVNHTGSGTTTLSGTNTYTGDTTISAGTLTLTNTYTSPAFGIASGATLNLSSGSTTDTTFTGSGTLATNGSVFWGGSTATFALGSGSLIDVQSGSFIGGSSANENWTANLSDLNVASGASFQGVEANVRVDALSGSGTIHTGHTHGSYTGFTFGVDNGSGTFSGVLADTSGFVGNFIKAGTGTQILTGANTYTGGTTISGGTLQGTTTSLQGNITNNAALVFDQDTSGSYAHEISGSGSLTKSGSGTTTLRGANTYTGGTTISSGRIIGDTTSLQGDITNNATIAFDQDSFGNYSGALSGSGNLIKSGSGSLLLSGANSYTGETSITDTGTLSIEATGSLTGNTSNIVVGNSDTSNATFILANGANASTYGGRIATTSGSQGTANISGTWTNTGNLHVGQNGTGSLNINPGGIVSNAIGYVGTSANSQGTAIIFGTWNQSDHLVVGLSGSGTLNINNGGIVNANSGQAFTNVGSGSTINILGSSAPGVLNTSTLNGPSSNAPGNLNFNHTGSSHHFTSNGASDGTAINITGKTAVNHLGTGTTILTGANTYTGGTTVSAGTLQGNTTSLTGNITNNATLAFDQNNDGTFSDVIGGSGSITKLGSGTVTLTGANTYTGNTIISAGTLRGTTSSLPGAIVNYGALVFDQNNDATFSNVISGTGSVTKLGTGTFTFSGANRYIGTTTLASGTIAVAGNTALGIGPLNLNGASLQASGGAATLPNPVSLNASTTISGSNALTLSGTVTLDGSDPINVTNSAQTTISGPIGESTPSTLIKQGSGELLLTGANTYSGGTVVSAGTLQGTTASLQGNIANNASLVFDQTTTGTYSDIISGSGALTKLGTGTVTFSGANSYTGGTSVSSGTLAVAPTGSIFHPNSAFNLAQSDGDNATLTIAAGATVTNTTGNLGLNAGSSGTADVSGSWINSSTLTVGVRGTGDLTIQSGGTVTDTSGFIGNDPGSTGTVDVFGTWNNTNNLYVGHLGSGDLTIRSGGTVTNSFGIIGFAGSVNGTADISGTWTNSNGLYVGNNNNATGTLTIQNGGIVNVNSSSLGTTLGAVGNAIGILNIVGTSAAGVLNSSSVKSGSGTATLNFNHSDSDYHFTSTGEDGGVPVAITGTTAVNHLGSGITTLSGTNTYTGTTTVEAGTLRIGAAGALSPNTHLRVQPGAVFDPNGFATSLGRLEGDGNLNLGSGDLSLNQSGDSTFAGIIGGTGGLAKSGAGRLTLSGNHTFTGNTSVSGGELRLNGTAPNSAFNVSGGRLSGSGTLGNLTLGNGGILAPGNSPGTLSASDTTWEGGATFEWEVNNAAGIVSTNWDLLNITGGLTINATSGNLFTINLVSLTAADLAGQVPNFDADANNSWTFVQTTTGITYGSGASIGASFALNTTGFQNPLNGTFGLAQDGNNLNVTYTTSAVPEPGTFALLAGLLTLGFASTRRKKR